MKTKILWSLVALLSLIQFIRPARNESDLLGENDITRVYQLPPDVHLILKRACYDCHSDNTRYPWYSNIQPLGWWLQFHVEEGKDELNFSIFGRYQKEDHRVLIEEIEEVTREGSMPLNSYKLMHPEADLTEAQIDRITQWAKEWD
jgi:Haem-binding domain